MSAHSLIDQLRTDLGRLSANSDGASSTVVLDQLGVKVILPAGWYIYGTRRNPIISAPAAFLLPGLAAQGPFGWKTGASVRIRRFRVSDSMTSEGAADQFGGLISSLGDFVTRSNSTLFDTEAVLTTVVDGERNWDFTVVIVVAGRFAFVVDYGCPQMHPDWCGELGEVADSLSFDGE